MTGSRDGCYDRGTYPYNTDSHKQHNEESGLSHLPVIVGMGGINAAGRTSGHQAFRRTVIDSLPQAEQQALLLSLAALMGLGHHRDGSWYNTAQEPVAAEQLVAECRGRILDHTLIRRIEDPASTMPACRPTAAPSSTCPTAWCFTFAAASCPTRCRPPGRSVRSTATRWRFRCLPASWK